MRGAGTDTEPRCTALRGGDEARVRRESQIVVAPEVQDLAPFDGDVRALRRVDRTPASRKPGRVTRGERDREFVHRARGQVVVRSPASSAVRPRRRKSARSASTSGLPVVKSLSP